MTKSKQELKQMTKQQLCDYCRKHKIKGYSGKTKAQRVDLIIDYYKSKKQSAKKQISRPEVKGKSEKQQVKEIIHNLRNKKYKEILISDNPDFSTYKCNACGLIDFPSKFAVIGNKRILCKKCEAKISKLQYKSLWDKLKSAKPDLRCEVCKGTSAPLFNIGKYKLICKDCWEKEKMHLYRMVL